VAVKRGVRIRRNCNIVNLAISSASERKETWNCMHFLVILSLKILWAGVKHWRTALHRFYVYRKPISSPRSRNLKVIQKCVHLNSEVHLYVFCLDNWSRICNIYVHTRKWRQPSIRSFLVARDFDIRMFF
jgi:hypothetical protein